LLSLSLRFWSREVTALVRQKSEPLRQHDERGGGDGGGGGGVSSPEGGGRERESPPEAEALCERRRAFSGESSGSLNDRVTASRLETLRERDARHASQDAPTNSVAVAKKRLFRERAGRRSRSPTRRTQEAAEEAAAVVAAGDRAGFEAWGARCSPLRHSSSRFVMPCRRKFKIASPRENEAAFLLRGFRGHFH